mgnify:CR=1 FL=1
MGVLMSRISDPYIWMENLTDPRLKEWISNQNDKTRKFLEKLPEELEPRIAKYFKIPYIQTVTVTKKGYFFLIQEEETQKIKLRTRNGEILQLVDAKELGKDVVLKYYFDVSKNGERLAYYFSIGGSDEGITRIIDVNSGEVIDELKGVIGSIVWIDIEKYYYVKLFRVEETPDGVRPPTSRIFLRENDTDEMVFGEGLPTAYFVGIRPSNDYSKALVTVSYGWKESTVYGGDLKDPQSWKQIFKGEDFPVYPIDYVGNEYLISSYDGEGFGKIIAVDNSGKTRLVIKEWEYPLQNAVVVKDKILAHYLVHASSRIKIFNLYGKELREIKFEIPGTIRSLNSNGEEAVFKYESFWIPYRIYSLTLDKTKLMDSMELKDDYIIEEDFTTSHDGAKIHLFIVRRRNSDIKKVLIFGYGGFRIPITPSYTAYVIPFIEDGGVYAIANIRGGIEYGEKWHKEGMREKKQNVFDDFIAAIQYFKKKGAKVVAIGRSNGGLLVGAVLTQRPELLDGAVIGYPVLDMLRFHKLYVGKAWVPEYGNPDNPSDAEFLIKYSPYHNIREDKKYPPTLVYTGLYDDRVHPAHAFKFVAKLGEVGAPIFLRVETTSGHAGATPKIRIREYSDIMAFVYKILGLANN